MSDSQASNLNFERERGVYAIQVTHDVAQTIIPVCDDAARPFHILQIFQILADAAVPVFLVKLHRAMVTLAVAGTDLARAERALAEAGCEAQTRRDLALVCVRATSMRDLSGVMVDIVDALGEADARLYETGDSHDSVQCLIEAACVPAAIDALCRMFRLNPDSVRQDSMETEEAA